DFARHSTNPLGEIGTVARLVALYRRIRPTHCHHFTIKCVLYGTFAARRAGVGRIINAITGRGYIFSARSRRIAVLRQPILRLYRHFLRGTDVIFQNDNDRRAFADAGLLGGARPHLIRGSGVDVERFRPAGRRFDRQPVSILFASRLLLDKGIVELVEAARLLRERGIATVVRIAGQPDSGNPRSVPQSMLASWAKLPGIELLGHRDDMAQLLAEADVVTLPTSYGEGIPRILIEAAASGLPLVATDVPGCRDIVRPGENGILVPERDAVALADALQQLALDPALRERMSARSREIACREFSEEQVLAATLAIYREPANA
ncbi:MAG: glycosyltransferase family 4 protein, partial [Casimicrobiaceae bacterium]